MERSGDPPVTSHNSAPLPSDRTRVLLEINNAVVSHLDLAQVLRAVSTCLRREIKHDFAGLALYDGESNQLRMHALDFPVDNTFFKKGRPIPLEGTPAGLAFTSRKPVLRQHIDVNEFPDELVKQAVAMGLRSGCAVPLICHDRIVGSLALASLRECAFTEEDAQLLSQIGVQIAIAVENALNFDKVRVTERQVAQERDRSRFLLEVTNAVVSHLNLTDLLKSLTASLRDIMPHDSAFINILEANGTQMRQRALDLGTLENVVFEEGLLIPLEGTPEEQAIVTRRRVLITSVADLETFSSPWVRYAIEHGVKSGCMLPLVTHGRVLGALGVVSRREAAVTEEDAKLLEQCSSQIAIAVENALNFENARQAEREVRQERDRSRLLLEVNNAVVSHLDLTGLLKSISASLRQVIPHDAAFLTLCDPAGAHLRVQALDVHVPQEGPFSTGVVLSSGDVPEGEAIRLRRPVIIARPSELARFSDFAVRQAVEIGVKSGCAVPLIAHGSPLGSLSVVSFQEAAFTDDDAKLLQQVCNQIALAVENALNFEKAREAERNVTKERDRSQLLLDINNALVSHLDLRELVRTISSSLQHVLPHDFVGLAIYDAESGKLCARAADSELKPMSDGIFYDPEGTVSGIAFKTGQPFYLPRPDPERFSSPVTLRFFERGLKTLYAVPVTVHGRMLGVLSVASAKEDALTLDDQKLFQEISKQVAIAAANALAMGDLEALKNKLALEKLYLEDEIRNEFNFEEIIGQSSALRQVLRLVETVAASDSTVLLLGETGTGKELIARAVHEHSRRKSRTFVKLNCAAIPTGLLESELFGHEKGAFTGAIAQKIGRLELADQGTLFLDEVGDIPVEIQPKLLRALQEREFERLGSTHTKKVNVRLVAATNRDLEQMIAAREFRSDLYYRLNVFPIRIPPLRERQEDIPLLVRYFADKFARQMQKPIESIPADTMNRLQMWHWPGNVREIENLIERAVILTNGSALQVPLSDMKPSAGAGAASPSSVSTLEASEREHIIKVLRETRGVLAGPNGAASRLGLKRTTLQYKVKKLGITRDHWWPASH
jgi:formate hydrogenlyase transcriptional activator